VFPSETTAPKAEITVGFEGIHGEAMIGMQGIGVNTPRAAAVAAATVGLAGFEHIPKDITLTRGMQSLMKATGNPRAKIWSLGMITSADGAIPKLHLQRPPQTATPGIRSVWYNHPHRAIIFESLADVKHPSSRSMDFVKSRLDKYIRRKYGRLIPQSLIERALRNSDILVNNARATAADKVSEGDCITVHPNIMKSFSNFKEVPSSEPLSCGCFDRFRGMIVYEDDDVVIINKPAGLATQLGSKTTVAVDIMAREYNPELRLVHRLDKETSGLTILAKSLESTRYMFFLFQRKQVIKRYLAIVKGGLPSSSLTIDLPIRKDKDRAVVDSDHGKRAITEFEILQEARHEGTLIRATPITGRTHQIRVHLSSIHCPVLGDRKYGGEPYGFLCLHSNEVTFPSMRKGTVHVIAPVPHYISSLLIHT
jgi:23S rRNA pseudouridine955/2504/2580 synthase